MVEWANRSRVGRTPPVQLFGAGPYSSHAGMYVRFRRPELGVDFEGFSIFIFLSFFLQPLQPFTVLQPFFIRFLSNSSIYLTFTSENSNMTNGSVNN